jgi:hypothetical protein
MKKNTPTANTRPPWAGLFALVAVVIWLAYLGSLTQLITNALGLVPTSLLWCLAFPVLLPISPVVACLMFGVWAPLAIAMTLPALSALGFWWEGRHGQ